MKRKAETHTEDLASSPELPIREPEAAEVTALAVTGRDEMNLAEFPFASLRRHGDSRKAIVYEGWITDRDGNRLQQVWTVSGSSKIGLPNEFVERMYVALMAVAAEHGFKQRKTPFSFYQLAKIMHLPMSKRTYQSFENGLKQLTAVTIDAEGSFWDNETKELVTTKMGFHIIEKYWLRVREKNQKIREEEGVPAYIVWSEDIWKSIRSGYLKSLDVEFYYQLKNPLARRLFRLLDKRLWNKSEYEFDIFDLAGKLGMVRYKFPAEVRKKIQPAIHELIAKGFLARTESIKSRGYSRIRFTRSPTLPRLVPPSQKPHSRDAQASPRPPDPLSALIASLVELGMARKAAQELSQNHPAEWIERCRDAAQWEVKQGRPIKNIAGYILRAVQTGPDHWRLPPDFKSKRQLEIEEDERLARVRQSNALILAQQEADRLHRQAQEQAQHDLVALFRTQYQTTEAEIETWRQALSYIEAVDAGVYQLSFASTQVLSLKEGTAIIGVMHPIHPRQRTKLESFVRSALKHLNQDVASVTFKVLPTQDT